MDKRDSRDYPLSVRTSWSEPARVQRTRRFAAGAQPTDAVAALPCCGSFASPRLQSDLSSKSLIYRFVADDPKFACSSVTLLRMRLSDCEASSGGAVALDKMQVVDKKACEQLRIDDVDASANRARANGGAFSFGVGTIASVVRSRIRSNVAELAAGGIELQAGSVLALNNSVVASNAAQTGAGVRCSKARLAIDATVIANNTGDASQQAQCSECAFSARHSPSASAQSSCAGRESPSGGHPGVVIAVSVVAAAAVLGAGAFWWHRRKRQQEPALDYAPMNTEQA